MWSKKWRPYLVSVDVKQQEAAWAAKGDFRPMSKAEYYQSTAYNSRHDGRAPDKPNQTPNVGAFGGIVTLYPLPLNAYPQLSGDDYLTVTGAWTLRNWKYEAKKKKTINKSETRASSESAEEKQKAFSQLQHSYNYSNTFTFRITNKSLKQYVYSLLMAIYTFGLIIGIGGILVTTLIHIPIQLFSHIFGWANLFHQILWFFIGIPIGLIAGQIAKPFRHWSGEASGLNRTNGMWVIPVTKKQSIHLPFVECYPYIQTRATATGAVTDLWCVHVKTGKKYAVSHNLDRFAAFLLQAHIRHFMDVSRPLPDTPDFEWWRPYDPITAEHDKQTGRDPRYWRDMPFDEFAEKINTCRERMRRILGEEMKIDNNYPTGKCD